MAAWRLPGWIVDLRTGEGAATFWGAAYFFCLLASYYALRPLREMLGIARGAEDLTQRFLVTIAITIPASLLFSAVAARLPRARFIPIVYRFCAVNLVAFYLLLTMLPRGGAVVTGMVFYSWLSVYNLFVVSVFWGFLAESFTKEQGSRLFARIGAGGTLGAICGSWFSKTLAPELGSEALLLVGLTFLEAAVQCARRLERRLPAKTEAEAAVGRVPARAIRARDAVEGFRLLLTSKYLLGIALVVIFYTSTSTFLYLVQGKIVEGETADRDARTVLFARMDLYANLVALLFQLFLTGSLLTRLGVGATHALLPAATIFGFLALAATPALSVLAPIQVLRRGGDYGIAKPAREVLFTVVGTREKYLAKNVIDTFVYRANDALSAIAYDRWILTSSAPAVAIAWVGIPISIAWVVLALWLGLRCAARSAPANSGDDGGRCKAESVG